MYCEYYQANLLKEKTWFLSAVLRNEANLVFARALEGAQNVFEFFVPADQESFFLEIMQELEAMGIVLSLTKLPNRLKSSTR